MSKKEISKNFKEQVVSLEKLLINNNDNENVITGTQEKPIVSDSEKIPIEHFYARCLYKKNDNV